MPSAKAPHQLPELTRIDDLLVVQHPDDVALLQTGGGGRAVRHDIIDHHAEAARQTHLLRKTRAGLPTSQRREK